MIPTSIAERRTGAPPSPAVPAPPPPGAFIQRHPVLTYYVLAFAISWVGSLPVVGGPGGLPTTPEQHQRLFPSMLLVLFAGPSGAGLLLTGLIGGRAGFRHLLARLFAWRVGPHWYAMVLLIAPLVMAATIFPLALTSPVFLPRIVTADDKASLVLGALAVGSVTGFLEELGWTGFAIPRLRMDYGVLATGVITGFLWGAWHYITAFWGSGTSSGEVSLPLFLPTFAFYVAVLPLYRVLMVWVHDRTESLLVAMLMHASLTASSFILGTSATGLAASAHNLVVIAALRACVAGLAVTNRRRRPRQPLRARVA